VTFPLRRGAKADGLEPVERLATLVEGPSLQERIDRGGPLPVAEAVEVARVLAEALSSRHPCNLLRRAR